eukprot:Platyproteum_vivax@DN1277_c0_g1_i1.p2
MKRYPQIKYLTFGAFGSYEPDPLFLDTFLDLAPTSIERLKIRGCTQCENKSEMLSRSATRRKVFTSMPNLAACYINKHTLEGLAPHNLLHLEVCSEEKLYYIG